MHTKPICCPRCRAILGHEIAGLHVLYGDHRLRTTVGHLLSTRCRCGGLWESAELEPFRHLLDAAGSTPITDAWRAALDAPIRPEDQAKRAA